MADQINALDSLRYIFEEEITDTNIRRFIFGTKHYKDKLLWQTRSFPIYFNNTLMLAFYFVYACYRHDMDQGFGDMEDLDTHNAKRIKSSLENALVRHPITAELVQFVLTDIQFELAQGESSKLKNILSKLCVEPAGDFSFNPYFSVIAEYNQSPSRFQCDDAQMWGLFADLLNSLSFLREYQLVQDGTDCFRFITHRCAAMRAKGIEPSGRDHYIEMSLDHLLFLNDSKFFGGIYRLFSIDVGEKAAEQELVLNLRYFTPGNDRSLLFSLPEEGQKEDSHLCGQDVRDVFEETVGVDFQQNREEHAAKKNSNSIDQIHAVNYRNVKNLALAISDALSSDEQNAERSLKSELAKHFQKEHPDIFAKRANKGDDELDWDSVVIMLLIESSPKSVLEFLIRKNKQIFYRICANLYARSYDTDKLAEFALGKDKLKNIVNELIRTKFVLGEADGFGKVPTGRTYEKHFSRAATMLILSRLNDLQEDDTEDSLIYTGNLRNNIALLQQANGEPDLEKRLKYACIILGETVKHTICFYEGLFAYGKAKANLDKKVTGKPLRKKDILEQQKHLETIFLKAARDKAETLPTKVATNTDAALKLLDSFVEFCKGCTLQDSTIKENSKHLHAAVGKYEMVDLRRFSALENRLRQNCGFDKESDGIWMTDAANVQTTVKAWVDTTLEILEFFATGSMRDTTMDNDLFNAVYPFTAVFNRRKENQDGYKTVNFSLNIDTDEDTPDIQPLDINVLSEFVYDRSEVYYCVPNVQRSNFKWWIDPILINFRDFNNIFSDIRKDDE